MLNQINFIGEVIKSEMKKTKAGIEYLRFLLSVPSYNRKYKQWYSCLAFGGLVKSKIDKGSIVYVSGRLNFKSINGNKDISVFCDVIRPFSLNDNSIEGSDLYEEEFCI